MKIVVLFLVSMIVGCGAASTGTGGGKVATPTIIDREVIESDGMYNGFPSVAEAADGDYVLAYQKGTAHTETPFIIMRRSADQGQTWSPEVVYFDTSVPDPSLASTPDGKLLLEAVKLDANSVLGAAFTISQDSGVTWGPFTFFDKPASNTYAFSTAFVTVGGTMYGASYDPTGTIARLWSSTDNGLDWMKLSLIAQPGDAGINETAVANVNQGRFLAVSRDLTNTNTWAHFSDDSGTTWGTQIDYTAQVGVIQLPQLLQVGNVLLLFGRQYDPTVYPHEFVVYASYDGGLNFTDRTVLDTYTGFAIDGGYCWPLLRNDGKVFVVYYADTNNLQKPDIKSLILQWNETQTN